MSTMVPQTSDNNKKYGNRRFLVVSVIVLCIMGIVMMYIQTDIKETMSRQPVINTQHGTKDTRFLRVKLIGGLGNHLWIYSSLYGLAKKTDRKPIACFEYDISKLFSNLSIDLVPFTTCQEQFNANDSFVKIQRNSHFYYDTELIAALKKSNSPNAYTGNYLQNIGYFVEYLEDIKAQLVIREKYQSTAQAYLHNVSLEIGYRLKAKITENQKGMILLNGFPPVFVAVHVRRGDILKDEHIKQPGPSYFRQAMEEFRKKHGKHVVFIVVSDDVQWSKANLTGEEDVYFAADSEVSSREQDFAIAVACNHTIISVGTFGWWMGFLTGGDVLYHGDWVTGDWKPWYHPGQYFPGHWKPLEVSE